MLSQDLWREKVSWDESVSSQLHSDWLKYQGNLKHLNELKIPRHVICANPLSVELHGFADASKTAYGVCIYVRSINEMGSVRVNLLCSKSRVAPLKVQTIPRLELCGALLLTKLMSKVKGAIDRHIDNFTYWSDSAVVLVWLRLSPSILPIFVSNRVAQIQESTQGNEWRHVPTKHNPADCLSRGVYPREIINHKLWWKGPDFLHQDQSEWPNLPTNPTSSEELNTIPTIALHSAVSENDTLNYFTNRYSSFAKLLRVLALTIRFINKLKRSHHVHSGYLKATEINDALTLLIKVYQSKDYSREKRALKNGENIKTGKLSSLSPFLDNQGILRVGGRLANSNFDFDKKFPMIIHANNNLSKLIMREEHLRLLHAGPQLLLASIREKFWPIRGRNLARKTVKDCVVCARADPKIAKFVMGNLPVSRVSPSPPFSTTDVDYAGPFIIKDKKGRGAKLIKCYISLFVCFATKAIHLEIVSDLTKESFIASLRRFIARRGMPAHVHSDNGTAFMGAHNELRELGQFLQNQSAELGEAIENLGISWHFIPAYSPHFGGIWEAGVKSIKFHIKRVSANAHLLHEEFYTLLTQVEAIVNSRPLCPLSQDPNDFCPLTPAHFLIGRTYTTIPDPNLLHLNEGRLSNWQRVQALQQHLWSRWSKEYISELQRLTKWKVPYPNVEKGTLVLLKDDNLPPSRWKLARIVETHPGSDNVTRVATVRTTTSTFRRALTKLCPFPIDTGSK